MERVGVVELVEVVGEVGGVSGAGGEVGGGALEGEGEDVLENFFILPELRLLLLLSSISLTFSSMIEQYKLKLIYLRTNLDSGRLWGARASGSRLKINKLIQ